MHYGTLAYDITARLKDLREGNADRPDQQPPTAGFGIAKTIPSPAAVPSIAYSGDSQRLTKVYGGTTKAYSGFERMRKVLSFQTIWKHLRGARDSRM